MAKWINPYGGRNDRALELAQTDGMLGEEQLLLRACRESGEVKIFLLCNDIFVWACADSEELPESEWLEFERSINLAREEFNWDLDWFAAAWAVKLRGVAPQKPATDRYPRFVKMLDFLNVPWREMKRYDQMQDSDE